MTEEAIGENGVARALSQAITLRAGGTRAEAWRRCPVELGPGPAQCGYLRRLRRELRGPGLGPPRKGSWCAAEGR